MNQTITVNLPKPHPGQREIITGWHRFNCACMGRRFGKTTLGIDRITRVALSGKPAAWFAPSYKMMGDVWRDTCRTLQPIAKRRNEQEKRLELITGGVIDFWSLDNPDAGRGRKYALAVIDEAAMVRNLSDAWNGAIRPTLTDYEGEAFFISTPKGLNFFKTLFDYGNDPARPDWACWQLPTVANPNINPAEVDAARQDLPERIFRQEYLAEFVEDANLFRNVVECATAEETYKAQPGREYVFGIDWGKLNDFTVITVWDCKAAAMVAMDRFNQIDYNVQSQRLKALSARFNPHTILAESNSMGEPIIDQLRADGLSVKGFATTNVSKAMVINQLSLAFEQKSIRILNDPVLIAELQSYEATRLPGGSLRYSAPDGQHDDTVMATAIGLHAVLSGKPNVEYNESNPIYG
jgi:phage terminase large subunit-like protein